MTIHRNFAVGDAVPEGLADQILTVRGQRVLLDADLAALYGVATKALKQAVRRNLARFPVDFAFTLTQQEFRDLRSQSVTSRWGGDRYPPTAFTEQGVAMLSSVLRSKRAVAVNIAIMRAFVLLRRHLQEHSELARQLQQLEQRVGTHDEQIAAVFEAIRRLLAPPPEPPRRRIGFDPSPP